MEYLLAISLMAGIFSLTQPSAGTYTFMQQGEHILQVNTKDGTVKRCALRDDVLACSTVAIVISEDKKP